MRATALCRLHAMPVGVVPGGTVGGWRERLVRCAARYHGRLVDRGDLPDGLLAQARAAIDAQVAALPSDVEVVPCHGAPSLREVAVAQRVFVGWRDLETLRVGDPWLDVAYFAFMTDGPESRTPTLVPILTAYREAAPLPRDLAGHPEVPLEVDLEGLHPRAAVGVDHGAEVGVGGRVVHEHVDAAEALDGRAHERLALRG